jgi:hypothetical protein
MTVAEKPRINDMKPAPGLAPKIAIRLPTVVDNAAAALDARATANLDLVPRLSGRAYQVGVLEHKSSLLSSPSHKAARLPSPDAPGKPPPLQHWRRYYILLAGG